MTKSAVRAEQLAAIADQTAGGICGRDLIRLDTSPARHWLRLLRPSIDVKCGRKDVDRTDNKLSDSPESDSAAIRRKPSD
jgi:hypothetical protein